ncbi:MAG: hypothetical protein V4439_01055 [Patescibacteria group bacterium]
MGNERFNQIQSLQEQGGEDAIKKLQEIQTEAELGFEGDVEKAAADAIEAINNAGKATTEGIENEAQNTANKAESMGGTTQEVNEVSGPIENEVSGAVETGNEEVVSVNTSKDAEVDGEHQLESKKQEKFNQFQKWFDEESKKKSENPESLVNRISKSSEGYKEILNEQINNLSTSSSDYNLKNKFNTTREELELSLPELYQKGVLSEDRYAYYIKMQSLDGNNLQIQKLNQFVENTPSEVLNKLRSKDQNLKSLLDNWNESISKEIGKELGNKTELNSGTETFREPEKLLNLVSSAARFQNKDKVKETVAKVVDAYLTSSSNLGKIRSKQDTFPVLENLCQAGFSDQALKIAEKGITQGSLGYSAIFQLKQKGYISEVQAKDLLEKVGKLN